MCNELHFKRLEADKCLYVKGSPHEKGDYVIIALYVDDIIISSNNTAAINRIIDQFKNRYKMKDLGTIQQILGTEVSVTQSSCRMSHHFLLNLLKHYGKLDDVYFTSRMLPISPATVLSTADCPQTPEDIEFMKTKPFRQLLGALLWLAINTRPDIMFAVTYVAKFAQNPGKKHWYALENILRYLKGTLDYGLIFEKQEDMMVEGQYRSSRNPETVPVPPTIPVEAAVDASHADDPDTVKSTTGYVFRMANAPPDTCSRWPTH